MSAAPEAALEKVRAKIEQLEAKAEQLEAREQLKRAEGADPTLVAAIWNAFASTMEQLTELRKQETRLLSSAPGSAGLAEAFSDLKLQLRGQLDEMSERLATGASQEDIQIMTTQLNSNMDKLSDKVKELGGGLPPWRIGVKRACLAAFYVVLAAGTDGYRSHHVPWQPLWLPSCAYLHIY